MKTAQHDIGGVQMQKLIYVADDDKNIRDLIVRFLRNDGFEALAFENGENLLHAFMSRPADMLILDIMMPGIDGLTLCAKIRDTSDVPIIIVSARNSEIDRINGITIGSDDYLVKPFSPLELVTRVKAIFRRAGMNKAGEVQSELCYGDIVIAVTERQAYMNGTKLELTPMEYSFLAYMVSHEGRAVSREELLKSVWRFETDVDTRATDDVVKRLRRKLASGKVRITSVWGYGFKLEIESETAPV
jgi:DNA-binding response OmpR family regulator